MVLILLFGNTNIYWFNIGDAMKVLTKIIIVNKNISLILRNCIIYVYNKDIYLNFVILFVFYRN